MTSDMSDPTPRARFWPGGVLAGKLLKTDEHLGVQTLRLLMLWAFGVNIDGRLYVVSDEDPVVYVYVPAEQWNMVRHEHTGERPEPGDVVVVCHGGSGSPHMVARWEQKTDRIASWGACHG